MHSISALVGVWTISVSVQKIGKTRPKSVSWTFPLSYKVQTVWYGPCSFAGSSIWISFPLPSCNCRLLSWGTELFSRALSLLVHTETLGKHWNHHSSCRNTVHRQSEKYYTKIRKCTQIDKTGLQSQPTVWQLFPASVMMPTINSLIVLPVTANTCYIRSSLPSERETALQYSSANSQLSTSRTNNCPQRQKNLYHKDSVQRLIFKWFILFYPFLPLYTWQRFVCHFITILMNEWINYHHDTGWSH